MTTTLRRIIPLLSYPAFTIAALMAAALAYKIWMIRPAASDRIVLPTLHHDAAVFAALILLYAVGTELLRQPTRLRVLLGRLSMAAGLLIVLFYLIDVFCYHFFSTRLYAQDVVTFSSELGAGLSLLKSGLTILFASPLKSLALLVAALVILRACWLLVSGPRHPAPSRALLLASAVLLVGFSAAPIPQYVYSHSDRPLYENFVERNLDFFSGSNFSDTFREDLLKPDSAPKACLPGLGKKLDILLVIVESLSSYHSRLFSGVEDWTPRLDRIAASETALLNFHANGFTTIGGLIALLGDEFPVVPERTKFNPYGSPRLVDFMDVAHPIARELIGEGYSTVFVAAGDLSFLSQATWLKRMGFQRLVGHDDPRFAVQTKRGPFSSVPDRLLYEVALEELGKMPSTSPRFMVVQTFWSHRPFMSPDGRDAHGEEPVIREADDQLGRLYERLAASGFLEKGVLIITGDHRAAERFRKAEFERFGASAVTRVPGIVATRAIELPRVISGDFQQRDFGASVRSLVGERHCPRPYEGTFLSAKPMVPRCIIHARGIDRDRILVKCGPQEGTVRISGDSTGLTEGSIDDAASVIRTINVARARRPVQ